MRERRLRAVVLFISSQHVGSISDIFRSSCYSAASNKHPSIIFSDMKHAQVQAAPHVFLHDDLLVRDKCWYDTAFVRRLELLIRPEGIRASAHLPASTDERQPSLKMILLSRQKFTAG